MENLGKKILVAAVELDGREIPRYARLLAAAPAERRPSEKATAAAD
jgi:hypothetical protein